MKSTECPYPVCIHDDPHRMQRLTAEARKNTIQRAIDRGLTVKEVAVASGCTTRTVYRVLEGAS